MGEVIAAGDLARWRAALPYGVRVVFTNGCFDLLHAGHVRYLKQARALGDLLFVALNSDASVRALKGESRPLNSEADRAEVLSSLGCVGCVSVFEGERCDGVIRVVRPDIYTKGGDYTPESLDPSEREALAHVKARIEILPLVPGRSTTAIIQKMNQP